jgi:hypothetical protein
VCLHLRIIIIIIIIHTLHHISVERDRYVYGRPSENLSNDANKWYRSPPRFSASGYNFFCDSANNANMKIHFFFCLWYYTTVVLTDVYRLRSLSLCNVIPRFLLGSPSDPSAPCGSETLHVQNYTSRLIIISMKAKSIKALGHNKTFPLRIVSLSLSFRHIFLHFFFFFLALQQISQSRKKDVKQIFNPGWCVTFVFLPLFDDFLFSFIFLLPRRMVVKKKEERWMDGWCGYFFSFLLIPTAYRWYIHTQRGGG